MPKIEHILAAKKASVTPGLIKKVEECFKVLEHTLKNTFQMNIVGKLQVPEVRDKGDIKNKEESLKEAYQLAEKLCTTK